MMHGLEKSDPVVVAMKPANKAGLPAAQVGGAEGGDRGEHGPTAHATDTKPL